jgi:hypothetical protein
MKAVLCEETLRLAAQVFRERLRAVVLTGSLARNEGTFAEDEQGCRLYGDAEFLLLFAEGATLPSDTDLSLIRRKIEERVLRRGLRATITLSAARPGYLSKLPPSIFAYELKYCGEVLDGDQAVLALVPDFTRADIPLEDAWRMLANRLVEQLESGDEMLEGRPTLSPGMHYRTVKLYLDMATSLLVFAGGYAPTYEERTRTLTLLARSPNGMTRWPFPLPEFSREVATCTRWKLSPAHPAPDEGRGFWERAVDHAQALWHWELGRLQGPDANAEARTLMARWVRHQPLQERLRGWAHVARQNGGLRSWPRWPRWGYLALSASPRYSVYEIAAELLFELRGAGTGAVNGKNGERQWLELGRRLPVLRQAGSPDGEPAWRDLAADVLFNYREYLLSTRS